MYYVEFEQKIVLDGETYMRQVDLWYTLDKRRQNPVRRVFVGIEELVKRLNDGSALEELAVEALSSLASKGMREAIADAGGIGALFNHIKVLRSNVNRRQIQTAVEAIAKLPGAIDQLVGLLRDDLPARSSFDEQQIWESTPRRRCKRHLPSSTPSSRSSRYLSMVRTALRSGRRARSRSPLPRAQREPSGLLMQEAQSHFSSCCTRHLSRCTFWSDAAKTASRSMQRCMRSPCSPAPSGRSSSCCVTAQTALNLSFGVTHPAAYRECSSRDSSTY